MRSLKAIVFGVALTVLSACGSDPTPEFRSPQIVETPDNTIKYSCDLRTSNQVCFDMTGTKYTSSVSYSQSQCTSGFSSTQSCEERNGLTDLVGTCTILPGQSGEYQYRTYSNGALQCIDHKTACLNLTISRSWSGNC